ncbi:DNA methyltransferase [Marivivens donghaensis]|uniref:DNA methyltransferase n=1 Tax=Marivivens donghaensis TaxID=1699413 RepID=UPI00201F33DF|nr:DNA methyltransferase [Marivivens donghaensis]MCL7409447.1 site-specific DNA-methyltransferase [Marivivens donghaensis]MDN3702926.1 DNA methyltransferase [Marivivens donghaensis]
MDQKLWSQFKKELPHKKGAFSKRNWGTPLHSLCSYQGKLKPALAHQLVQVFSKRGQTVFDPFSGSGTVPLEAAISGRCAVSNDLSDMAVAMSNAKIGNTNRMACDSLIDALIVWVSTRSVEPKTIEDTANIRFNKTIAEYFEPNTFQEVLKARDFFAKTKDLGDPNWCLVFSAMLHILHGNRPYALSRNSHPLTPYAPTGDYVYKNVSTHLRTKVHSALAAKESLPLTPQSISIQSDVRDLSQLADGSIDVIITSPPFASSTRFYMTNWMRFWFCGWSLTDFDNASAQFIEGNKDKSLIVYEDIFKSFGRVLKSGGPVVLHVGKNKAVDMSEKLQLLKFNDFEMVDVFSECVGSSEKHGIKDKGGTVEHQYLVYAKK